MTITRELLAQKILGFLNRKISANDLACWAETCMIESDYQEEYFSEISDSLAKIGLINVKNFELPVSFYLNVLIQLNFLTVFGLEQTTEKVKDLVYV